MIFRQDGKSQKLCYEVFGGSISLQLKDHQERLGAEMPP